VPTERCRSRKVGARRRTGIAQPNFNRSVMKWKPSGVILDKIGLYRTMLLKLIIVARLLFSPADPPPSSGPETTNKTTINMTSKRFKELSEILNERLRKFAGGKSRRSAAVVIANRLHISADAIDSWRRGTRCIPEEKIEPLVRALKFVGADNKLTPEGLALTRQLSKAREEAEVKRSWQERVEEGDMILQVRELTIWAPAASGAASFTRS
jgi:hypothetical protein